MRHYCTYFDTRYLAQGLALYASLRRHERSFCLWVLCMDEQTSAALERLALPGLRPVAHADFARGNVALAAARAARSRAEYYFTCTPLWLHALFERHPEIELLTYLDADLFFFGRPQPLFDELGTRSIQLIEHRFPPRLQHLLVYGRFNVGWISVRRDAQGLAFVKWWSERCLEWCFSRLESGRYADQGYLDEVPARFQSLSIVQHPGANLALWNLERFTLARAGERVLISGGPLLFYHFHNLREVAVGWYNLGAELYELAPSATLRRAIYAPYLVALDRARRLLRTRAGIHVAAVGRLGLGGLLHRLRFHRSLVMLGGQVFDVDVMHLFGALARVWRPLKLVLRRGQRA